MLPLLQRRSSSHRAPGEAQIVALATTRNRPPTVTTSAQLHPPGLRRGPSKERQNGRIADTDAVKVPGRGSDVSAPPRAIPWRRSGGRLATAANELPPGQRVSRRSGCSPDTSTRTMRTPSGSSIHILIRPHGSRLVGCRIPTPRDPSHSCFWRRGGPVATTTRLTAPSLSRPRRPRRNRRSGRTPPHDPQGPELPLHRQPEEVPVEPARAGQVGRPKQDAAAEDLHGRDHPRRQQSEPGPSP